MRCCAWCAGAEEQVEEPIDSIKQITYTLLFNNAPSTIRSAASLAPATEIGAYLGSIVAHARTREVERNEGLTWGGLTWEGAVERRGQHGVERPSRRSRTRSRPAAPTHDWSCGRRASCPRSGRRCRSRRRTTRRRTPGPASRRARRWRGWRTGRARLRSLPAIEPVFAPETTAHRSNPRTSENSNRTGACPWTPALVDHLR